jgi:hypothetical protein
MRVRERRPQKKARDDGDAGDCHPSAA